MNKKFYLLFFIFQMAVLFSLPEEIEERIYNLVLSNPGQLSFKEYALLAETICKKAPCSLLVFGMGKDSSLWKDLNQGGLTIFLENNLDWYQIVKSSAILEGYLIEYTTKRKDWEKYLQLDSSSELLLSLPDFIQTTKWDVIFIDGPEGWSDDTPGRMQSIYTASHLVKNSHHLCEIFVHDCDRIVELECCHNFLGDIHLYNVEGKLHQYIFNNP